LANRLIGKEFFKIKSPKSKTLKGNKSVAATAKKEDCFEQASFSAVSAPNNQVYRSNRDQLNIIKTSETSDVQ